VHVEVRAAALFALGTVGGPDIAPFVAQYVKVSAPPVREAAVWVLNSLRHEPAIDVVEPLLDDKDVKVRIAAHWYFAETAPVERRAELLDALQDADDGIREAAVWGVASVPAEDARAAVKRAFDDPSRRVRAAAAWASASFYGADSVPCLLDALADPDATVRRAAAEALSSLEHPAGNVASSLLSGTPRSWEDVAGSMGAAYALPFLDAVLESENAAARRKSLRALGRSGEVEIRPALEAHARSPLIMDRLAATLALADLDRVSPAMKIAMLAWAFLTSVFGLMSLVIVCVPVVLYLHFRQSGSGDTQAG
jgi:HEAT repeat protein